MPVPVCIVHVTLEWWQTDLARCPRRLKLETQLDSKSSRMLCYSINEVTTEQILVVGCVGMVEKLSRVLR